MNAVDTNILFYAHDPRETAKQKTASDVIGDLSEGALVWQVACDLWASRNWLRWGIQTDALEDICNLRQFWATIVPDWAAWIEWSD